VKTIRICRPGQGGAEAVLWGVKLGAVPSFSALRGENINHRGMVDAKNLTKNEKPKTQNGISQPWIFL
jgi:hypothetical protein